MDIQKTLTDGLKSEFKVTIPAEKVIEKINEWLVEKAKTIRMDGFRPGKVPLQMVRQRYADQAQAEIMEWLVQDAAKKVLEDHKMHLATQPIYNATDIVLGQDFDFSLSFESMPEIILQDFKKIKFEKLVVDVDMADVQESLQKIAEGYQKFSPAAEGYKAKEGDKVTVDVSCKMDGKVKLSYSGKGGQFVLGDNELEMDYLEEKLIGCQCGDELDVDHVFEQNDPDESVAGKKATFHVKINEISQPESLAISDELAKELDCDDLADLTAKIQQSLQTQHDANARLYHKRLVLDTLADTYDFDLPQHMIKAEFDIIWKRLQDEIANAATNEGTAEESEKTDEELRVEYEGIAKRRVKLGLIIAEISKVHNIVVTPDMIRNLILREALNYPGQERTIIDLYRKYPNAVEKLTSPALEDLVIDFVLSEATLTEKKISKADLYKKVAEILPGDSSIDQDSTEERA
ncbi:MAG: trigger factor [Alphaproteobacteria bacterium]|nr:trigger factor [Alphaproteobacteria bacterium]